MLFWARCNCDCISLYSFHSFTKPSIKKLKLSAVLCREPHLGESSGYICEPHSVVFWHAADENMNSPWTPARPSAAPLLHCLPDELWCECVRFRLHRHVWLSVPHVPFHACFHSKHLTYHECLHLQPGWIQLGTSRFLWSCCCSLHL